MKPAIKLVAVSRRTFEERFVHNGKPTGRYWARFPVNGRYTRRLLAGVTTKSKAIAAAQEITSAPRDNGFTTIANRYIARGCPTSKKKSIHQTPEYIVAETRQALKLADYFRNMPISEVNSRNKLEEYADWRFKQFTKGKGGRAVTKEWQTLSNIVSFAISNRQAEFNFVRADRPQGYYEVKTKAKHRMPESADEIHRLAEYFLDGEIRSEVFAWMTLFQMFTGCRTSELLRLRTDAVADEAGHVANAQLHLGRRSKSGINPFCDIGPDFADMIRCFQEWHAARFPKSKVYFPSPFGDTVNSTSHLHAVTRACKNLGLHHITPHGFRAYYVTKRRRENALDSQIAAEIGDKTVALISTTYGDVPKGPALQWKPAQGLPAWLRWQPTAQKIARIA